MFRFLINHFPFRQLLLPPLLLITAGIHAAENKFKPGLELSAGVSHDSSLVVEEIDLNRKTGDEATNLEARVSLEAQAGGFTGDLSYTVADIDYREMDQFDLNTHLLMSSLGYDIGKVNLGITYYRAASALDGEDYLTLSSGSPTLSFFATPRIFLQLGVANIEKEFEQNPAHDAQSQRIFASSYYFLSSIRHYLVFTYAQRDEDANALEYDYTGDEMELSWIKVSEVFNRDLRLRLGAKFERRDYAILTVDGVTSQVTSQRQDRRRDVYGELTLDLSKRTFTGFSYRYSRNDSNEDFAEYDQHSAELYFGFRI